MAGVLANTQSKLGHEARAYSFTDNCFNFSVDFTLTNPNSVWEFYSKAFDFATNFDIFQFYFGESLLGNKLADVSWLSRLGKKIFFYFCGCDIRDEKTTIMKYPISACANCFPKLCSPNRQLAYQISKEYGRVNFVSTPDLLEFVERSVLLPQVIDFDLINTIKKKTLNYRSDSKLTIAHAPSNRKIKGTDFVIKCIDKLKDKGCDIELKLIERKSHAEALRIYSEVDIAIDQLLIGSYGLVSAEMMALGIPTIVYLREDLLNYYPEPPPLINANPNTLEQTLINFYENRDLLKKYRNDGIDYAYKVHHPSRIAIKCLEYYEL